VFLSFRINKGFVSADRKCTDSYSAIIEGIDFGPEFFRRNGQRILPQEISCDTHTSPPIRISPPKVESTFIWPQTEPNISLFSGPLTQPITSYPAPSREDFGGYPRGMRYLRREPEWTLGLPPLSSILTQVPSPQNQRRTGSPYGPPLPPSYRPPRAPPKRKPYIPLPIPLVGRKLAPCSSFPGMVPFTLA
jgi:hypothetical protein